MAAAQETLEGEIARITTGEDWQRFLTLQARLHHYSANNTQLIWAQHAEAHAEGPLPFRLQGDGQQMRAFMHIDDCAEAVGRIIVAGEHGGIYHVGNPEEWTIADVARKVVETVSRLDGADVAQEQAETS
ncbi:MAG: NAD-dependent epimerase/dehydratase family protein [Actinobacteria bacterium]|nr:NAD-dependent epimerase/dehydratase family protein [Actinomycetota bacterium]